MINGGTRIIPHIGWPTTTFKAPLIYNPFFAAQHIPAVVVPFGITAENFEASFRPIMAIENVLGALITMPHKINVVGLLDEVSRAVAVSGACNAVRKTDSGVLEGDNFDGLGFVRSATTALGSLSGANALVVGAGGVGRAIVASLAEAGVGRIVISDIDHASAEQLARRVTGHFPHVTALPGLPDPFGCDLAVNATPLGMQSGDPLPFEPARLSPSTYVADVVMRERITPLLAAAAARGCRVQPGLDMLFEMIPAYLEFFGLPVATAAELKATAVLDV